MGRGTADPANGARAYRRAEAYCDGSAASTYGSPPVPDRFRLADRHRDAPSWDHMHLGVDARPADAPLMAEPLARSESRPQDRSNS